MQDHRRTRAPSEVMIQAIQQQIGSPDRQEIDAMMEMISQQIIRHCPFLCGSFYGPRGALLRESVETAENESMRIKAIQRWMKEATVLMHVERMMVDQHEAVNVAKATLEEPIGKGFSHLSFRGPIDGMLEKVAGQRPWSKVGWSTHGYHMKHGSAKTKGSPIPEEMKDRVYPKSVSSMITVGLLQNALREDVQFVIDMCAAPGGKTVELITELNGKRASLLSNDISGDRMEIMSQILREKGVYEHSDIQLTLDTLHGTRIGERYKNSADIVVCDVPCSGIGNLYEEGIFVLPSREFSRELSRKQLELLKAAISATRPGGYIAYSTCTLSMTENEGVIDQVRRERTGAIEIIDPRDVVQSSPEWPLEKAVEASLRMQRESRQADKENPEFKKPFPAVRLDATTVPGISTGFFAALIRKKA